MPYEPQAQKPQAQNVPSANQIPSNPAQVGNNVKKDEPTAQGNKDSMKDKDGNCSTSDKKSTQGGCN